MTGPVVSHYLCPECGTDWADTWECACNSQCPSCGIKDIEPEPEERRTPEDCCNMEMQEAFELVLRTAREMHAHAFEHKAGGIQGQLDELQTAIGLVTAFYLLKVKG